MIGKFMVVFWVSSMSPIHPLWEVTSSTLIAIILQLRFSNSPLSLAAVPSSVVQTGVKSLGWENRIAHWLPIHSWNLTWPMVVSAAKSGAIVPSWIAMIVLLSPVVVEMSGHA